MHADLVTLTTDFGLSDSYVAQMKGVLLSLRHSATIVDITHSIPKFNVAAAARVLSESAAAFPPGTIHIGVVDPGVGSSRRRLIIEAAAGGADGVPQKMMTFIGPDNGIFSLVAPRAKRKRVWEITELELFPRLYGATTFEGRDIFAPVAALICAGRSPEEFGSLIETESGPSAIIEIPQLRINAGAGFVEGWIAHIDGFGNAATSIQKNDLSANPQRISVCLGEKKIELPLVSSYSSIPEGRPAALFNSQGYLEIAANRRPVSELCLATTGTMVRVEF